MRQCANAVFLLPREAAVVRLAPVSQALLDRAQTTVRMARWLENIGFPAVRLLAGVERPVVAGGCLATFWQFIPQPDRQPEPTLLVPLLAELHELIPPFSVPRWSPVADARRRLSNSADLASAQFLSQWCDRLDGQLSQVRYELPASLIHGDAWVGNLLWSDRGVVLSDLDQVCFGPREWDLVPTVVNAMRFGEPSYESFLRAYGHDVTAWPGFPVLREARELTMLTGVLPALASSPSISAEFERRMADLREEASGLWAPYK
ncbi:phosphotransferase [Nonomuraea sp. NN258]|nr:phosphotransferase [Nonomuraea antri]